MGGEINHYAFVKGEDIKWHPRNTQITRFISAIQEASGPLAEGTG